MPARAATTGTYGPKGATNLQPKPDTLPLTMSPGTEPMAEAYPPRAVPAVRTAVAARPLAWQGAAAPSRTRYVNEADADLIGSCIAGDQQAWEAFIARYQGRVYNITYHMTQDHDRASDLAQEAFIQILRSLPRFRAEASLSTWVHGLTMRVCLHHMRRERRRQMESWEDVVVGRAEPETTDGRPHETVSRTQLQRVVRHAISQLPLKFRAVMVLHGLAGMTYEETAAALSLPLNTVKTRVHRAKGKLRTHLKDVLGEDGNGL